MKRKIFTLLLGLSLLCGCSFYERSDNPGTYASITTEELDEKLNNQESFVLSISATYCSHCHNFKRDVLTDYLKDHEINYYNIVSDQLEDIGPVFEILKEHPYPQHALKNGMDPDMLYTPLFYFIKDGEFKDTYLGTMDEKTFDGYIVKYQLDKKK